MTDKYELTDEHRAQMKPWADKWIANALRCGGYTDEEKGELEGLVHRLYEAGDLQAPDHVVTCLDPVSAVQAWVGAVAIYWARDNAKEAKRRFGEHAEALLGHVACDGRLEAVRTTMVAATGGFPEAREFDAKLADEARKFLRQTASDWRSAWQGGNHWSGEVAFLSFFRHVAKLDIDYSKWDCYERLAAYGPRMLHERFCIVAELPEYIYQDPDNRPHREDGPFCRWRSGRALYYWHGTEVPAEWIESPDTIPPETALTWENIEQRRCAAEIMGWAKVLDQLDCKVIDEDSDPLIGRLVEVELPDAGPARFLDVQCGTGRRFAISVPEEMTTAIQAQAWTYGVDEGEILSSEART